MPSGAIATARTQRVWPVSTRRSAGSARSGSGQRLTRRGRGQTSRKALLAVLLWPADRAGRPALFTAARAVGAPVARALWLVLWLSLAYFALLPGNRAPQALNGMITSMESGEPGWLAALDRGAASLVAHQGLAASVVLAVALVIAVGVFLPAPAAKAVLALAIVVAAVIWVFGEAFGGILTGGGTDPNSGPLIILLALTYWPVRATVTSTRTVLTQPAPMKG